MSDFKAHWLNLARVRIYSATIFIALFIYMIRCARLNWKSSGMPNGFDFVTFWAASHLSLEGKPLRAYSFDAIVSTAKLISVNIATPGPWSYPPTFLLVIRPLALLPAGVSYALFALATATLFVCLLRRILPMSAAWLPILGFPGLWLNLAQGQNGCVTASLALAALLLLKSRPALAGVCIGLLVIKPHLGILFPLALACAGMWVTFIAAALTAVLFTCVSIAVYGTHSITLFLSSLQVANGYAAQGFLPWAQMASPFAMLRQAHLGIEPAYVVQACFALAGAGTVAWVWRNAQALETRAAALVAGTFMVSPYIFNYDAVWLGIPIALLTVKGLRDGWLRWEREILLACWLYPALGDLSGYLLHIGFGPLVFVPLLFVAVRRTAWEKSVSATAQGKLSVIPTR
jgi:hypothetical protein